MLKNKAALSVTAVAIVALMIVGATLAWFTDNDSVTNVVTFGNVDVDLTEEGENPTPDGGLEFEDVVPGDKLEKKPVITNTGANDAFIRVKVVPDLSKIDTRTVGAQVTDLVTALKAKIEADPNWEEAGDWFYYVGNDCVLAPGASVDFFDGVEIPTTWKDDMENVEFSLVVSVEAVQADNILGDGNSANTETLAAAFDSAGF